MAQKLSKELSNLGCASIVEIHDRNLASEGEMVFTNQDVRESIIAELATESHWRAYLNPQISSLGLSTFMQLRKLYRNITYRNDKGQRILTRLVNIELAHLNLMKQALDSGVEWVLIVEDDAQSVDIQNLAANLANFIKRYSGQIQPSYLNLSKSFSDERLNTQRLLSRVTKWGLSDNQTLQVYASDRPFTNTVCAILYRRDFLLELSTRLSAIPLRPVLPIDWKLNKAILTMVEQGSLGSGDCWTVEPGPIIQGSMINS